MRLISRQVTSSVYVGEKVSDFTQPMRSSAGNVDQFLLRSSRVRCSVARQLCNLSLGVWLYATQAAAWQLAATSELGTPSATGAARVRRAETLVVHNEMARAKTAAQRIQMIASNLNMVCALKLAAVSERLHSSCCSSQRPNAPRPVAITIKTLSRIEKTEAPHTVKIRLPGGLRHTLTPKSRRGQGRA